MIIDELTTNKEPAIEPNVLPLFGEERAYLVRVPVYNNAVHYKNQHNIDEGIREAV